MAGRGSLRLKLVEMSVDDYIITRIPVLVNKPFIRDYSRDFDSALL